MSFHKLDIIAFALLISAMPLCMGSTAWSADKDDAVERQRVIDAQEETTGKKADQLLKQIKKNSAHLKYHENRLDDAGAEDRQVLELQIYNGRVKILKETHLLADTLVVLEKKAPQPEMRRELEKAFTRIVPQLWFHIDRLRLEIDQIRARRYEAAVEALLGIEYEVAKFAARLDVFYRLSHEHLVKMDAVGMEVEESRQVFIEKLQMRVNEITGRVDLGLMRITELERQNKALPDDAGITTRRLAADMSLKTNIASLGPLLKMMESLGQDTKAPRALLVSVTRDIGSGLLDKGVAVSLVNRSAKQFTGWVLDKGPGYLVKLIVLSAIFLTFVFASRIIRAGLEKALEASNLNLSTLGRRMLVSTASKIVMILGILVILSQVGISLGPLLAGLGVVGFIVGFALQDSLSNFAAGVMILLYRPYDVGDFVDVGGVFGTVDKMSLVSTSLLTIDNQLYIVPNSKIWGDVIKNVTAQKLRRVDLVFGISYSDDIEKAEAVLADILQSHDKVLDHPESMIRLHKLGDSSVDFVVRPWVKVDDYWDVYWDVTRTVKMRFDKENISIPFPQRDVHLYNEDK